MTKASTKAKNATRAQKVKSTHEEKNAERKSDQQTIKAAYLSGNGEVVLEDLLKKIPLWQKLNTQIAQDGVGARPTGYKLADGSQEIENIYLTPEQRATYLDKNAGMQVIFDYIERQMTQPQPDAKPKTKQKDTVKTV